MDGKMKVAVMTDIQKIEFEERPIPTPKDDEVLVKLDYVVQTCTTMRQARLGILLLSPPLSWDMSQVAWWWK